MLIMYWVCKEARDQQLNQWLRWHGFHGFLGTHQFLTNGFRNPSIWTKRTIIRPLFSSKQARNRGWEFRILNQHFGTHQFKILTEPLSCCKSLSFRNVGWPACPVCLGRWEVMVCLYNCLCFLTLNFILFFQRWLELDLLKRWWQSWKSREELC